jgi:branched-chain amino acid transport system ATP-binding protein
MALLEASDITTGYGDAEILHSVSMELDNSEIISIIGPNGAGKSTLMKAIFGLVDCWSGTVTFAGENITHTRPDQLTNKGMCYVPQTNNVFPSLSVQENLRMGAYVLEDVSESDFSEVLDLFPILRERKNQQAGSMSGGQQQMLAMARALIPNPNLLLIDEPSAGLAPEIVDDVFTKIAEINDSGTSILMVEQNTKKALSISDRGYVLLGGENHLDDTGANLLNNEDLGEIFVGG